MSSIDICHSIVFDRCSIDVRLTNNQNFLVKFDRFRFFDWKFSFYFVRLTLSPGGWTVECLDWSTLPGNINQTFQLPNHLKQLMNSIEQLMFDWRTQSSKHQCPAGFLVKSPTWSFLPPPTSHIHFSPNLAYPSQLMYFFWPLIFCMQRDFFTFKVYTKIIGTYCYISSGYWSPLVQKSGSLPHVIKQRK